MQKVTKEYEVFEFSELSEGAKKKALEQLRYINVGDEYWGESILEEAKEELAKMGYLDAKIFYSGFSSQGDGASFECHIDISTWLKAQAPAVRAKYATVDGYSLRGDIKTSGRYSHEYSMSVDIEQVDYNEELDNIVGLLSDDILADARAEAKLIYRRFEKEYYDAISDEAVIEMLEPNEILFHKNGKQFIE